MVAYFNRCEYCGAALDPGERCDCRKAREETRQNGMQPVKLERWKLNRKEPRQTAATAEVAAR